MHVPVRIRAVTFKFVCIQGFARLSNVNQSSNGGSSHGREAARGGDLIRDLLKVTLPPPPHHYQSMKLCVLPHEETGGPREEETEEGRRQGRMVEGQVK